MMGYRDPNDDDWEGEYWDDYIKEFGVAAYIEMRYQDAGGNLHSVYDTPESWSAAVDSLTKAARNE